MQWCVRHRLIEPTFVLRDRGELVSEFEALGPVLQISAQAERGLRLALDGVPFGSSALAAVQLASDYRLRRVCQRQKTQVIYVNTATQDRIVSAMAPLGLPIVIHVHELERELRSWGGVAGIENAIDKGHTLMAVSRAVRKMLVAHGANSDQIVNVQEPISDREPPSAEERCAARRATLDVDDDAVVVAGCGSPSWRKGTDMFLQVAQHTLARAPADIKVAFRWIGGEHPNEALSTLIDDIACLGLDGQVAVIHYRPDADRLLAAADVFISTSREDPNPLVVLEAAAAGCPIVCFQGAGGAEELADAGGGKTAPYLDAKAMADTVLTLIESPEERKLLGNTARTLVNKDNATRIVAEQVAAVLRRCAGSSNHIDLD